MPLIAQRCSHLLRYWAASTRITCQYSGLLSMCRHLLQTPDSRQRSFVPARVPVMLTKDPMLRVRRFLVCIKGWWCRIGESATHIWLGLHAHLRRCAVAQH